MYGRGFDEVLYLKTTSKYSYFAIIKYLTFLTDTTGMRVYRPVPLDTPEYLVRAEYSGVDNSYLRQVLEGERENNRYLRRYGVQGK